MSSATLPPYWQASQNLGGGRGGGRCNVKSLPCASIPNAHYRYDSPDAVAAQRGLPEGAGRDPGVRHGDRPQDGGRGMGQNRVHPAAS